MCPEFYYWLRRILIINDIIRLLMLKVNEKLKSRSKVNEVVVVK